MSMLFGSIASALAVQINPTSRQCVEDQPAAAVFPGTLRMGAGDGHRRDIGRGRGAGAGRIAADEYDQHPFLVAWPAEDQDAMIRQLEVSRHDRLRALEQN